MVDTGALEHYFRELRDRQEIIDVQTNYCWLIDRGRPERLIDEVYTSDAIDDHGSLGPVMRGADQINAGQVGMSDDVEGSAHCIMNPHIEIHGDEARGRFYFQVYVWRRASAHLGMLRPADMMLLGVYDNQFRREPHGWRISHQKLYGLGTGSSLAAGTMPADFKAGIGGYPSPLV